MAETLPKLLQIEGSETLQMQVVELMKSAHSEVMMRLFQSILEIVTTKNGFNCVE